MSNEGEADSSLTCSDCGADFVFTARDQAFYQERGFQAPRRCKDCRSKRKDGDGGRGGGGGGGGASRGNSRGNSERSGGGGYGGGGGGYGGGGGGSRDRSYGGGGQGGGGSRERSGGGGQGGGRSEPGQGFKVICSGCNSETTVPFQPDPSRPVFCRTCYQSKKKSGPAR